MNLDPSLEFADRLEEQLETATSWGEESESYSEDSGQDVIKEQSPSAYPPGPTEVCWEEFLTDFGLEEQNLAEEAPPRDNAEKEVDETQESSESMTECIDPRLLERSGRAGDVGEKHASEKQDSASQSEHVSQNPVVYALNFVPENTLSFLQHFNDHRIYVDESLGDLSRPENLQYLKEIFSRPRSSLSQSKFIERQFREFKACYARASASCPLDYIPVPIIDGRRRDLEVVLLDSPLDNFYPLTDGTVDVPIPYEAHGAYPGDLLPQLRKDMDKYIAPTTRVRGPVVPNFFLETGDPIEPEIIIRIRAAHMGALGARAMQCLRDYMEDRTVFTNRALTITSTYHCGQLKLFAHHIKEPCNPGARPEYIMTLINSWTMVGSLATFLEGVTWYRNARDWARERRDDFIKHANLKLACARCRESPPVEERVSLSRSRTLRSTDDSPDTEAGSPGFGKSKQRPGRPEKKSQRRK